MPWKGAFITAFTAIMFGNNAKLKNALKEQTGLKVPLEHSPVQADCKSAQRWVWHHPPQRAESPTENPFVSVATNQNHRLSRWYAPRLQGDNAGSPTRALNWFAKRNNFSGYRSSGIFYAFVFLLPVNGSIYSVKVIWSYAWSSANWFWIYAAIARVSAPAVFT